MTESSTLALTTSDPVPVTNTDPVTDLLDRYWFSVEPELAGETVHIQGEDTFEVYAADGNGGRALTDGDKTTTFLGDLAPFLSEPFEIKSVQIRHPHDLDATKWVIRSGTVYRNTLDNLSPTNMRFAID